jgi:hypothetical protein
MKCGFEYGLSRRDTRLRALSAFIVVFCNFSALVLGCIFTIYSTISDWYDYTHWTHVGKIDLFISLQADCFRAPKANRRFFDTSEALRHKPASLHQPVARPIAESFWLTRLETNAR